MLAIYIQFMQILANTASTRFNILLRHRYFCLLAEAPKSSRSRRGAVIASCIMAPSLVIGVPLLLLDSPSLMLDACHLIAAVARMIMQVFPLCTLPCYTALGAWYYCSCVCKPPGFEDNGQQHVYRKLRQRSWPKGRTNKRYYRRCIARLLQPVKLISRRID
jgi:hypothetical protein